jgi:hypothetical protein
VPDSTLALNRVTYEYKKAFTAVATDGNTAAESAPGFGR